MPWEVPQRVKLLFRDVGCAGADSVGTRSRL